MTFSRHNQVPNSIPLGQKVLWWWREPRDIASCLTSHHSFYNLLTLSPTHQTKFSLCSLFPRKSRKQHLCFSHISADSLRHTESVDAYIPPWSLVVPTTLLNLYFQILSLIAKIVLPYFAFLLRDTLKVTSLLAVVAQKDSQGTQRNPVLKNKTNKNHLFQEALWDGVKSTEVPFMYLPVTRNSVSCSFEFLLSFLVYELQSTVLGMHWVEHTLSHKADAQ